MRLGVFLPNWIGDVVMATPALNSLRELAGSTEQGGRLIGVMRPYVSDVVDGLNTFDRQIFYKPKAKDPALRGRAVIDALREEELDAVVLLTNSLRTAWLAWRSGAGERIGYERDQRSWLLTTRLRDPCRRGKRFPLPQIDSYLNLAYAAGGAWRAPDLQLSTTAADEKLADDAWARLRLPAGDRVVVFNTGGAYGDAKSWPAAHFSELAKRLVSEEGLSVLVNCGPGERETANQIASDAGSAQVVSLGQMEALPIGLSKAIIRRSRLLVSTDSGPRFFGIAFQKPVVAIFGPTDPEATKTHYAGEERLSLSLGCQFCWERECPIKHHRCMQDLSVERVLSAVRNGLTQSPADCAA